MYRRVVQVKPYGKTTTKTVNGFETHVENDETVTFQFPRGVIDLSTLQFMFRYARLGVPSTDTLPKDTETLIDELEVRLGSTVVNRISNYQQLFFMLSAYSRDADWMQSTKAFPRLWTNRRCMSANVINWPYGMDTFLGFLGCKQVIDTRKTGLLTVRMRLGPSNTVNSSVPTNQWGMRDPFFRVHYLPDSAPSVERVVFEDFTSIHETFPGYDCKSTLIVDGRRKIDYVLARQVRSVNYETRFSGFDGNVGLTQRFVATGNHVETWEFYLNNTALHSYQPSAVEALLSMRELFPDGVVNMEMTGNPVEDNNFHKPWCVGMRLDLPQREDGQQWEIAFETSAVASAVNDKQHTFLYAKTTSTVDCSSGKLILTV